MSGLDNIKKYNLNYELCFFNFLHSIKSIFIQIEKVCLFIILSV